MSTGRDRHEARLRRLIDELADEGFADMIGDTVGPFVEELDYARHPKVHERRVPTFGAIIGPTRDWSEWQEESELSITHRPVEGPVGSARYFADGLSSWLVRQLSGAGELAVFDRASGSEQDLVVLAKATGGRIVQRHPSGTVRAVGDFGVIRWDGLEWQHEAPIDSWINSFQVCDHHGDREVLVDLLEFAVHDLGARGIGALLVYRPDHDPVPNYQVRLPPPPALRITRPADLAPLRHVLAQVDGAAVFTEAGELVELGVRLVPSPAAESEVDGFRGMRHTAGRRYSFDDEHATVIVVSEDGPVSVWRNGHLLGGSHHRAG